MSTALFACVLLSYVSIAYAVKCSHTFTDPVEATFDLSKLQKDASNAFQAMDTFVNGERPYNYHFNVCGDTEFTDPDLVKICEKGYPAYQIINDTDPTKDAVCMPVGQTESMKWSLINGEDDAELGVSLNYTDGQECSGVPGKERSFVIHFKCRRHKSSLPAVSSVTEFKVCEYEVTMHSFYACPVECRQDGEEENLCGNHGNCGLDMANKSAHCYCNDLKTGADCVEDIDTSPSTDYTSSLLAVIIILLILIAVLVYVLYKKIKLLNEDSNPYQAYDEDGVSRVESGAPIEEDEETL